MIMPPNVLQFWLIINSDILSTKLVTLWSVDVTLLVEKLCLQRIQTFDRIIAP